MSISLLLILFAGMLSLQRHHRAQAAALRRLRYCALMAANEGCQVAPECLAEAAQNREEAPLEEEMAISQRLEEKATQEGQAPAPLNESVVEASQQLMGERIHLTPKNHGTTPQFSLSFPCGPTPKTLIDRSQSLFQFFQN
ncbi:MAG: hypothetical protein MK135_03220 [Polyangiaceae bacterium]|nr:hypothetical protein [Polyangiaceae bacterium]